MLDVRPAMMKAKEMGLEIANIPKALRASFDLSFPFRQGLFLVTRPQFWHAFYRMHGAAFKEASFQELQSEIRQHRRYELGQKVGLATTDVGGELNKREEPFIGGPIVEIIPGIRPSNRAYVAMGNKLRQDTFGYMVDKAEKLGYNVGENKFTKKIANYVNEGSGRGKLPGNFERIATELNAAWFSPRLMSSRIHLLTKVFNPKLYTKENAFIRKEYLRDLFGTTGVVLTVLGLAKAAGAEVGYDPRSADFGKIKIRNTRLDIGGGLLQYIRLAAQLLTNKTVDARGHVRTLGKGYKPETRLSILGRFITSKEAPLASFASDLLRGQTWVGEKLTTSRALASLFVPMIMEDFYDIAKDDPELLPLIVPGIYGGGLSTYKSKVGTPHRGIPSVLPPSSYRAPSVLP
jgi:hypothetical protein